MMGVQHRAKQDLVGLDFDTMLRTRTLGLIQSLKLAKEVDISNTIYKDTHLPLHPLTITTFKSSQFAIALIPVLRKRHLLDLYRNELKEEVTILLTIL